MRGRCTCPGKTGRFPIGIPEPSGSCDAYPIDPNDIGFQAGLGGRIGNGNRTSGREIFYIIIPRIVGSYRPQSHSFRDRRVPEDRVFGYQVAGVYIAGVENVEFQFPGFPGLFQDPDRSVQGCSPLIAVKDRFQGQAISVLCIDAIHNDFGTVFVYQVEVIVIARLPPGVIPFKKNPDLFGRRDVEPQVLHFSPPLAKIVPSIPGIVKYPLVMALCSIPCRADVEDIVGFYDLCHMRRHNPIFKVRFPKPPDIVADNLTPRIDQGINSGIEFVPAVSAVVEIKLCSGGYIVDDFKHGRAFILTLRFPNRVSQNGHVIREVSGSHGILKAVHSVRNDPDFNACPAYPVEVPESGGI